MCVRRAVIAALLLCHCPPVLAGDANWPQFRGPQADGVATTSKHPTEWSLERNLAWKVAVAGIGWSQPSVWDGKVFLTTAVADKLKRPRPGDWSPGEGSIFSALFGGNKKPPDVEIEWQVLCLDLASGKVLWEQTASKAKPKNKIHPSNSYATETPVTDGELLVASFGMAGVYCYDLTGKLLWTKDLGSYPTQMDWGTASSPVMHGELVFLQCDNDKSSFLVALDKKTGDEVWRVARSERSNWCTPLVWKNSQRTELVTGGGNFVRSYDPASGQLLWEMAASGRCSASPLAVGDLLVVNSGDRLTGQRGLLAALKPGGSGDISLLGDASSNQFVAWSAELTGHRVASPVVSGECLYLLEQQAGILRCMDIATGKQHYRQRMAGATGLTASPWTSGSKVFCLDQSGQTFVLEPAPEYKVLYVNKLGDEMYWATPAIAGDALLIRSIDNVYCIR